MRIFHFAFLFSLLYSQYHSSEWESITSLLTPTGIQVTGDGIVYASTSGGLLKFNPDAEEFNFIKTKEGLVYLDLASIATDSQGRFWLGGANPMGYLQIYDPHKGFVQKIIHLEITKIDHIVFGGDVAFAVYEGTTSSDIGILKFDLDEAGLPEYIDYYSNFSADFTITEIRDLDVYADSVFITTERGIFGGNYTFGYLKDFDDWTVIFDRDSARQFIPADRHLIVANQTLFKKDGSTWAEYDIRLTGESVQAEKEDNIVKILTEEWYLELTDGDTLKFAVPFDDESDTDFTGFTDRGDGSVIFGMKNHGILILNKETENYNIYTPNTPFTNKYNALTITSDGHLAATSQFGTLYFDGIDYKNYIPDKYYKYYSGTSETFHSVSLEYSQGEHFPISIIEKDNGNLIYCNSGVFPEWETGAVIELDHRNGIITKYDNTEERIDGWDGIYASGVHSNYMLINQIEKDKLGNIWVVNPYCERNGHLLAIQSSGDKNTWFHVNIPDSSSFRPQAISFDQSSRAWVGFVYELLENRIYSNGGIKVFKYTDLKFEEEDSTWISIENPDVLPGNSSTVSVWSIVFDHMGFLWVLSEKGIQGYEVSGNNEITLDPLGEYEDEDGDEVQVDFLTHLFYEKGNRIKVDSQNNKWIITHQGVWVIQESMAYWPSEDGLHPDNSGLLSDIVYDVAFDNDNGLAYLATDKGISILQIPFADNPETTQSIYISPNPFIVPDDEFVMIKNIPSGATIQIMTITGVMIKKMNLGSEISQYLWDGRNEKGEVVGTAVYLIAAHHPNEPNMVSKLALIRN